MLSERPSETAHHAATASVSLSVQDVHLAFGGLKALDGASWVARPGIITSLIGPNGAGKTTMFNTISGLLKRNRGTIRFAGRDLGPLRPDQITNLGLVRTFQIARGFPNLSVFEHLMVYGKDQSGERFLTALLRGKSGPQEEMLAEKALAIAARLRLSAVIDNLVGALSGGQKKLLEIGRALMASPSMIMLDEPAAGVNPTLAEEIGDHLRTMVAEGTTILLIEHDMALVERISDHVIVMANGRTLAEGTFDAICDNSAVQDAYLGKQQ